MVYKKGGGEGAQNKAKPKKERRTKFCFANLYYLV